MALNLKKFEIFSNQLRKFESFLQSSCVIQKPTNFYSQQAKSQSSQKYFYQDNLFKYGAIVSFLSAFGLFLYSCKDKFKISFSLCPTVQALTKTETSLRKQFNFISEVVEKSADAVVFLENPVLFRYDEMEVPGVRGGSGFIVRDDGIILTNAHVVADIENNNLYVKLKDGRIFPGIIESIDYATDLATVRIKADNLPVMTLGSSADLKAGEWVIAIGSPLFLENSVSVGIVSSLQRKGEEIGQHDIKYIQTDAAIFVGNSGGPLVNLDGEVVGVNTLRITSGISFAVPIDYAKEFLKKSEEEIKCGRKNIGMRWPNHIGIFMQTLTPEIMVEIKRTNPCDDKTTLEALVFGVIISGVTHGSPAFKGGLLNGDIVMEANGERVMGIPSFLKILESHKILNLKVFRGNGVVTIIVVPDQKKEYVPEV